jgi:hypothetical protein
MAEIDPRVKKAVDENYGIFDESKFITAISTHPDIVGLPSAEKAKFQKQALEYRRIKDITPVDITEVEKILSEDIGMPVTDFVNPMLATKDDIDAALIYVNNDPNVSEKDIEALRNMETDDFTSLGYQKRDRMNALASFKPFITKRRHEKALEYAKRYKELTGKEFDDLDDDLKILHRDHLDYRMRSSYYAPILLGADDVVAKENFDHFNIDNLDLEGNVPLQEKIGLIKRFAFLESSEIEPTIQTGPTIRIPLTADLPDETIEQKAESFAKFGYQALYAERDEETGELKSKAQRERETAEAIAIFRQRLDEDKFEDLKEELEVAGLKAIFGGTEEQTLKDFEAISQTSTDSSQVRLARQQYEALREQYVQRTAELAGPKPSLEIESIEVEQKELKDKEEIPDFASAFEDLMNLKLGMRYIVANGAITPDSNIQDITSTFKSQGTILSGITNLDAEEILSGIVNLDEGINEQATIDFIRVIASDIAQASAYDGLQGFATEVEPDEDVAKQETTQNIAQQELGTGPLTEQQKEQILQAFKDRFGGLPADPGVFAAQAERVGFPGLTKEDVEFLLSGEGETAEAPQKEIASQAYVNSFLEAQDIQTRRLQALALKPTGTIFGTIDTQYLASQMFPNIASMTPDEDESTRKFETVDPFGLLNQDILGATYTTEGQAVVNSEIAVRKRKLETATGETAEELRKEIDALQDLRESKLVTGTSLQEFKEIFVEDNKLKDTIGDLGRYAWKSK